MVDLAQNKDCQQISWISSHQMMEAAIGPNQKVFKKLTSMIQYSRKRVITRNWHQISLQLRKNKNEIERWETFIINKLNRKTEFSVQIFIWKQCHRWDSLRILIIAKVICTICQQIQLKTMYPQNLLVKSGLIINKRKQNHH